MLCYNKTTLVLHMPLTSYKTLFTASALLRAGAVAAVVFSLWLAVFWAISLP